MIIQVHFFRLITKFMHRYYYLNTTPILCFYLKHTIPILKEILFQTLDLSNNNLKIVTPSSAKLSITTLNLSDNPELTAVCTKLLRSLPDLKVLFIFKLSY